MCHPEPMFSLVHVPARTVVADGRMLIAAHLQYYVVKVLCSLGRSMPNQKNLKN